MGISLRGFDLLTLMSGQVPSDMGSLSDCQAPSCLKLCNRFCFISLTVTVLLPLSGAEKFLHSTFCQASELTAAAVKNHQLEMWLSGDQRGVEMMPKLVISWLGVWTFSIHNVHMEKSCFTEICLWFRSPQIAFLIPDTLWNATKSRGWGLWEK